jgi:hypothetical protein
MQCSPDPLHNPPAPTCSVWFSKACRLLLRLSRARCLNPNDHDTCVVVFKSDVFRHWGVQHCSRWRLLHVKRVAISATARRMRSNMVCTADGAAGETGCCCHVGPLWFNCLPSAGCP